MKILSKTILVLLGIFLIIIYAFSLNNESLHILIENTENTYYADVLIDKELVLNQLPTTIIDSDQSTDMNILKNFEYEGKKAMQMNTYVEYSGKPTDYRCRQIGNACTFALSSKMPETVQLVLMDDAYNFYIFDEKYTSFRLKWRTVYLSV